MLYSLIDANNLITIAKAAQLAEPGSIEEQVYFIQNILDIGSIVIISDVIESEATQNLKYTDARLIAQFISHIQAVGANRPDNIRIINYTETTGLQAPIGDDAGEITNLELAKFYTAAGFSVKLYSDDAAMFKLPEFTSQNIITPASVSTTLTLLNDSYRNGGMTPNEYSAARASVLQTGRDAGAKVDTFNGRPTPPLLPFTTLEPPANWNVETFPANPGGVPTILVTPIPAPATPATEGFTPTVLHGSQGGRSPASRLTVTGDGRTPDARVPASGLMHSLQWQLRSRGADRCGMLAHRR